MGSRSWRRAAFAIGLLLQLGACATIGDEAGGDEAGGDSADVGSAGIARLTGGWCEMSERRNTALSTLLLRQDDAGKSTSFAAVLQSGETRTGTWTFTPTQTAPDGAGIGTVKFDDPAAGWSGQFLYSTMLPEHLILTTNETTEDEWAADPTAYADGDDVFERTAADGTCVD